MGCHRTNMFGGLQQKCEEEREERNEEDRRGQKGTEREYGEISVYE